MDWVNSFYKEYRLLEKRGEGFSSFLVAMRDQAMMVADVGEDVAEKKAKEEDDTFIGIAVGVAAGILKSLVEGAATAIGFILKNKYVLMALGLLGSGYLIYRSVTNIMDKFFGDEEQGHQGRGQPYAPPQPQDLSSLIKKRASTIESTIKAAKSVGVDIDTMLGIVKAESSFGSNTYNPYSSAQGPFQILKSTWNQYYPQFAKKYGIPKNDPNDPESAAIFSAAYVKDVLNPIVRRIKGRDANAAELYMLYVFGPAGGASLIREFNRDPQGLSAPLHSKRSYGPAQIRSNPTFFYHKDGSPKTLAETFGLAQSKVAFTEKEVIQLQSFAKKKEQRVIKESHQGKKRPPMFDSEAEQDYREIVQSRRGYLVGV